MPKTITSDEVVKKLDWIDKLPNKGGDWGKGVLAGAKALAKEVDDTQAEIEKLMTKRTERMKVLRRLPVRAKYDAKHLFDEATLKDVLPAEDSTEE
jgi:hypothetical protein